MIIVEFTAEIVAIFAAEIVNNNFEKRVLWVKEPDVKYPNHYSMEMVQGAGNILDGFRAGQKARFRVEIRGQLWKKGDKETVFNSMRCTNVYKIEDRPAPSERQQTGGIPHKDPKDDLPF